MTKTFNPKFKTKFLLSMLVLASHTSFVSAGDLVSYDQVKSQTKQTLKYSGVALVAASALRFFTRDGDNLPNRYDWDAIAAGQDLPDQLYYLWDDGLVGHPETKSSDVVDKERGKIERKRPHTYRGLGGLFSTYYKSVLSALGVTWITVTAAQLLAEPDTTTENFVPRLAHEIKLQLKNLGFDSSFEVFVPVIAGAVGYQLASAQK